MWIPLMVVVAIVLGVVCTQMIILGLAAHRFTQANPTLTSRDMFRLGLLMSKVAHDMRRGCQWPCHDLECTVDSQLADLKELETLAEAGFDTLDARRSHLCHAPRCRGDLNIL